MYQCLTEEQREFVYDSLEIRKYLNSMREYPERECTIAVKEGITVKFDINRDRLLSVEFRDLMKTEGNFDDFSELSEYCEELVADVKQFLKEFVVDEIVEEAFDISIGTLDSQPYRTHYIVPLRQDTLDLASEGYIVEGADGNEYLVNMPVDCEDVETYIQDNWWKYLDTSVKADILGVDLRTFSNNDVTVRESRKV